MGPNIFERHSNTRAVLDAIRRIVQALRESSRAAERHVGLSGAQVFVLHTLAARAPLSLNELAAATHTHQSSVSVVVAHLVEQGLVRRGQSACDARRLELSLTTRGRGLAVQAPDAAQQRLVLAIDRLSSAKRQALAASLTELAQSMTEGVRVPPMFFEDRAKPGRRRRQDA